MHMYFSNHYAAKQACMRVHGNGEREAGNAKREATTASVKASSAFELLAAVVAVEERSAKCKWNGMECPVGPTTTFGTAFSVHSTCVLYATLRGR